MNPCKKRIYFSYQEILDVMDFEGHPYFPNDKNMHDAWFTEMLDESPIEFAVYTLSEFFTDSLLNEIVNALMGIVYNRHADDFIVFRDMELNESEDATPEDALRALNKLINVINNTLPRYVPLLQQNEIASTDPIAPVSSVSKSKTRFNDTPQDGGLYEDDPHTTNLSETQNETSVDSASLMERLDQLFKNFRSIILEWSNEFNMLFLKEEQIPL